MEKCGLKKWLKTLISQKSRATSNPWVGAFFVVFISSALTAVVWLSLAPNSKSIPNTHETSKALFPTSLFASHYPANGSFQKELVELKNKNQLKENDELEIHHSLLSVTDYLDIPPALMWCLLFQESRLDHLDGLESEKASLGLGQFSRFSFFEINHHLDRYDPNNINLIHLMFGRDIRPIMAKKKDLVSPSSYYSIPTAVTSSALYLNNRYRQLTRLLDKREINYNRDILWLFSAMAYNKGTRSVLSLWNSVYRKKGSKDFSLLVNDLQYFKATVEDSSLLTRALKKIWDETKARPYAKELKTHTQNISSCSINPLFQTTRSLTESAP